MGWDTSAILLRGDSVTALSWAEEGRFRSDNVINAATVFVMLGANYDIHIVGTEAISSEQNWKCDLLSRRGKEDTWGDLVNRMSVLDTAFGALPELQIREVQEFVNVFDPRHIWGDEISFGSYWRHVYNIVIDM